MSASSLANNAVTAGEVARDPDTLYAAALGALHMSPAVQSVLSPLGAQLFKEAYSVASEIGGQAVSTLGAAAIENAVTLVGEKAVEDVIGIAGSIVEGIGSAIPAVGIFVSIIQIMSNPAFAATGSDSTETDCTQFFSAVPGNSGPSDPVTGNTATTPADIFSSSEPGWNPIGAADANGNPIWRAPGPKDPKVPSDRIPSSAIGRCLAAITETSNCDQYGVAIGNPGYTAEGDSAIIPDGGLHTPWGIQHLVQFYKAAFPNAGPVGVPQGTQKVFKSLRLAMASNGPDHGAIPYALWMDMLAAEYDAGRLTPGYMAFLLNNWIDIQYVGDYNASPHVPVLRSCKCSGPAVQTMVTQIVALIQAWKETRKQIDFHKKVPARAALLTPLARGASTAQRLARAFTTGDVTGLSLAAQHAVQRERLAHILEAVKQHGLHLNLSPRK